jgi:hypothetical protein
MIREEKEEEEEYVETKKQPMSGICKLEVSCCNLLFAARA